MTHTQRQALAMLQAHHMEAYPEADGTMRVKAIYCKDGVAYEQWEHIEADRASVRDWLGY